MQCKTVFCLHPDTATPVEPGSHQDQGVWSIAYAENGAKLLGSPLSLVWLKPTRFGKYGIGDHTFPEQSQFRNSLEMKHQLSCVHQTAWFCMSLLSSCSLQGLTEGQCPVPRSLDVADSMKAALDFWTDHAVALPYCTQKVAQQDFLTFLQTCPSLGLDTTILIHWETGFLQSSPA